MRKSPWSLKGIEWPILLVATIPATFGLVVGLLVGWLVF